MLVCEKTSFYFTIELTCSLREISDVVYVQVLVCVLMMLKLCAVEMRNAILRNHLNS